MILLRANQFRRQLEGWAQRKFIDWKKTKLFGFRWNWDEEKKLRGIRLQNSSLLKPVPPFVSDRQWRSFSPGGGGGVVRILKIVLLQLQQERLEGIFYTEK